jgi:hypothetical protein
MGKKYTVVSETDYADLLSYKEIKTLTQHHSCGTSLIKPAIF